MNANPAVDQTWQNSRKSKLDASIPNMIEQDALYLLTQYLRDSPFQKTFQSLCHEIEEFQGDRVHQDIREDEQTFLLPGRIDWLGKIHPQNFTDSDHKYAYLEKSRLLNILKQYTYQSTIPQPLLSTDHSRLDVLPTYIRHSIADASVRDTPSPIGGFLEARALGVCRPGTTLTPKFMARYFEQLFVTRGHLRPVYCILFDLTGRFIISGGDDCLVKVWCAQTGWLLRTLRAHQSLQNSQGVILDVSLNASNTLLATASSDRSIRVWDFKAFKPVCYILSPRDILQISFSLSPNPTNQCLLVSCADAKSRVYRYDGASRRFSSNPIMLDGGTLAKDRVRVGCFSETGSFFATGGDDGILYLFSFRPQSHLNDGQHSAPASFFRSEHVPRLIRQFDHHKGRINDISFSSFGNMILTASKDGAACLHTFHADSARWTTRVVKIPLPFATAESNEEPPRSQTRITEMADPESSAASNTPPIRPYEITQVAWNADDTLFITASTDFVPRVWNVDDCSLRHELRGHTGPLFVMRIHPSNTRILLTSGHDKKVIIWDIVDGTILKEVEVGEVFLNIAFSMDGRRIVCSDEAGRIHCFGFGIQSRSCSSTPRDQFFNCDFVPVREDQFGGLIDEQTQLPAHLVEFGDLRSQAGTVHQEYDSNRRKALEHNPPTVLMYENDDDSKCFLEIEKNCPVSRRLDAIVSAPIDKKVLYRRRRFQFVESDDEAPPPPIVVEVEPPEQAGFLLPDDSSDDDYESDEVVQSRHESSSSSSEDEDGGGGDTSSKSSGEEDQELLNELGLADFVTGDEEDVDMEDQSNARRRRVIDFSDSDEEESEETHQKRRTRGNSKPSPPLPITDEEDEVGPSRRSTRRNATPRKLKLKLPAPKTMSKKRSYIDFSSDSADDAEHLSELSASSSKESDDEWAQFEDADQDTVKVRDIIEEEGDMESLVSPRVPVSTLYPSEWVSTDIQERGAYLPQLKDPIVYVKALHKQFISASPILTMEDDFPVSAPDILTGFIVSLQFSVTTHGVLATVHFQAENDNQPEVEEGSSSSSTSRTSPQMFTFRVHATTSAVDFFVLAHDYQSATLQPIGIGETFNAIYADAVAEGVITNVSRDEDNLTRITMEFVEGGGDVFYPWEVLPVGQLQTQVQLNNQAEDAVSTLLQESLEDSELAVFMDPVPYSDYPVYLQVIGYPMYFNLILERIKNKFYRSIESVAWDVEQMARNAMSFNQAGSFIYEIAETRLLPLSEDIKQLALEHPDSTEIVPVNLELKRTRQEQPDLHTVASENMKGKSKTAKGRKKRRR